MAETFWEQGVAVEARHEAVPQAAPEEISGQEPAAEPRALTVSIDDFAGLESRVLRAVALVKEERQGRTAAESRATQAEAELEAESRRAGELQSELEALRAERAQVKTRIERLLEQLDTLGL